MKTLLALPPLLAIPDELNHFSRCLDFLQATYHIEWLDPLSAFNISNRHSFLNDFLHWIRKAPAYDVILGFSFGGSLILNALEQFKSKRIVLISTPSQLDITLKNQLKQVTQALERNDMECVIHLLINFRGQKQIKRPLIQRNALQLAHQRVQLAIPYILENGNVDMDDKSDKHILQIVGENSQLITENHIKASPISTLRVVSNAGMRVLEDNPAKSQNIIKDWLNATA